MWHHLKKLFRVYATVPRNEIDTALNHLEFQKIKNDKLKQFDDFIKNDKLKQLQHDSDLHHRTVRAARSAIEQARLSGEDQKLPELTIFGVPLWIHAADVYGCRKKVQENAGQDL